MNHRSKLSIVHLACLFLACLFLAACDSSDPDQTADSSTTVTTPQASGVDPEGTTESDDAAGETAAPFDRDASIKAAETLARSGKLDEANEALQRILLANPEDYEVVFRMARLQADAGDLQAAVELLDSIPADAPGAGLPALGQAADWYLALEQYDEAESRYLKVLEQARVAVVHRQLAYLYNRQGRRHEAADHLRALCRLGNVQQDELHGLMVLSHAIFDDPNKPSPGRRPYYPIGPAAEARMLYTASRFVEAVETLDESVRSGTAKPSIVAFYGLLAIESQDSERFQWWLSQADESVKQHAEYWAAIGAFLIGERRFEEAVRALAEAIDRDPTNIGSMRRISQALTALGRDEEADRWMDRYVTQRDVTLASNAIGESETPDLKSYNTVADGLDKLDRPLEAMTWRLLEAFYRKAPQEEIDSLKAQLSALLRSDDAFPDRLSRVCGIDVEQFPMPKLDIPDAKSVKPPSTEGPDVENYPEPRFDNLASAVGLEHTFWVADKPQPFRFSLYQSLGGGIAVLDYDLDGTFEFYLAQGRGVPPSMVGELSNVLYRHVDGKLQEVSSHAGVEDRRYTVGVTSGDWNQDGFADLVLGNIGQKVMLINNGDGTFRRQEFDPDPTQGILTSSLALADLTGDALPDLYSLYYVEDPSMLDRPDLDDQGNVLTVSPASFTPGIDRIAANDGRGGMNTKPVSPSSSSASTGLGVVIADWDGQPGNEVFVGNDVRPNQLWLRSEDGESWNDVAAIKGCAYGVGGSETASMGIAVADFDGNGARDIHITNFYLESVSLFMNRGGTFEDRCVHYRLNRDSSTVLGFGCQALDYNNDGRPDLAVTNGNIEKAPGEPLEQSPQFFINLGDRFKLLDVNDASGYWQGKYLGRCMARLDFDQDGKQDVIISHLDSPTALMLNRTESQNHWLSVQLVGTESERDAIGTQVEVHAEGRVLTGWIVGGDGYLCRNEPTVSFGLGQTSKADKVVVTWPTGKQQVFNGIAADQRVLLVEGQEGVVASP